MNNSAIVMVIMKTQVLKMLMEHRDEFISGQQISDELGVSRTAVWKVIDKLKKQGYNIQSQTKKGYKLVNEADDIRDSAVKIAIGNISGCNDEMNQDIDKQKSVFDDYVIFNKVIHFDSIDSTNTKAKIVAEQGEKEGTIIVAEEQVGGRGRLGRVWKSPKSSGLWMSMILRPNIEPSMAAIITQIAAVAVRQAIKNVTGIDAGIKWPNDIWIGNKKVCGILTEMSAEFSRLHYVVLGIGINVNMDNFDADIADIATSLKIETKSQHRINRADIIANFIYEFSPFYRELVLHGTFDKAMRLCKKHSITLGKDVYIMKSNEKIPARTIDILDTGELLVLLDDGTEYAVNSGEVSIRNR